MNGEEILACLAEKLALLDKIGINTAYQGRLLTKRRLGSLGRLLSERSMLIEQFGAIDAKLSAEPGWKNDRQFAAAVQTVTEKQKKVLTTCRRVLNAALAEHMRIGAEIGASRVMRRARDKYASNRGTTAAGLRLNIKG